MSMKKKKSSTALLVEDLMSTGVENAEEDAQDVAQVGSGNAGLRLLDALFDDVAYARYLLQSKLPQDALIKHKVNWKDQQTGASLLHTLVYSDLDAPVKLLLQHTANPNIRNKHHETPLHWCARQNSMKCAALLLDFQADVNALDNSDSSPLHVAAAQGNVEISVLLVDRGADVHLQDKDHLTAIELVAETSVSVAQKAIFVVLLRHYERSAAALPRSVSLKLSMQSAEIAAAATGLPLAVVTAALPALQNNKSFRSLGSSFTSKKETTKGKNKGKEGDNSVRPATLSSPLTVYDQFVAGTVFDPEKTYKALKMKALAEARKEVEEELRQEKEKERENARRSHHAHGHSRSPHHTAASATLASAGDASTFAFAKNKESSPNAHTHTNAHSGTSAAVATPSALTSASMAAVPEHSPMHTTTPFSAGRKSPTNPPLPRLFAIRHLNTAAATQPRLSPSPTRERSPSASSQRHAEDPLPRVDSADADLLAKLDRSSSFYKHISKSFDPTEGKNNSATIDLRNEFDALLKQRMTMTNANGGSNSPNKLMHQISSLQSVSSGSISTSSLLGNNNNNNPNSAGNNNNNSNNNLSNGKNAPNSTSNNGISGGKEEAAADPVPVEVFPTQADIDPSNSPLLTEFPSAEFVPFLPQPHMALGELNPGHLDVLIEVEHCCDCQFHNDLTLRHDPKRYVQVANQIIHGLVKTLASHNFSVRVFAMRSKITAPKRIGAMEVSLSLRVALPEVTDADLPPPPSLQMLQQMQQMQQPRQSLLLATTSVKSTSKRDLLAKEREGKEKEKEVTVVREKLKMPKPRWATTMLFSKLHTKSWPNIPVIEQRAVDFLEAVLKEAHNTRRIVIESRSPPHIAPSQSTEDRDSKLYKRAEVTTEELKSIKESYDCWTERMKIPPRVERDPLDLDFPTDIFSPAALKKSSIGLSVLDNYVSKSPSGAKEDSAVEHPKGPYLDPQLCQRVSKAEFERLTLEHFLVFDARYPHNDDGAIAEEDDEA